MSPLRLLFRVFWPSRGVRRVAAYFVVVFVGLAFFSSRVLYADMERAGLALGHELRGLSDLTRGAEVVLLNGQRFHHASVVSPESVHAVLERLEAHCDENPSFLGRALAGVSDDQLRKLQRELPGKAIRHAVVRDEAEDRGMVVCFVDERPSGLAEVAQRVKRFTKTHDLTEFGHIRYGYAEGLPSGRTHVVTLWADSGMNLTTMFPATGDAAGADSAVVPRPPGSRRMLAASAEGLDDAVRLYTSTEPPEAVRGFYDTWMREHHWQTISEPSPHQGRAYLSPDGYQAFMVASARSGKTSIALTEAGRQNGESIATIDLSE